MEQCATDAVSRHVEELAGLRAANNNRLADISEKRSAGESEGGMNPAMAKIAVRGIRKHEEREERLRALVEKWHAAGGWNE